MAAVSGGRTVVLPNFTCKGRRVMRKISIRVTDQQYEFIEQLVASGDYANTSEVIREALRLFMKVKRKEMKEVFGDEIRWRGENV